MEFSGIIDLIILACGAYCVYTAYSMKASGEIKSGFLMSSQVDVDKCKDKAGYIEFMWKKTLIFGIIVLLYSGVGLIDSYVTPLGSFVVMGAMGLFFIALVWFGINSSKGMKTFF